MNKKIAFILIVIITGCTTANNAKKNGYDFSSNSIADSLFDEGKTYTSVVSTPNSTSNNSIIFSSEVMHSSSQNPTDSSSAPLIEEEEPTWKTQIKDKIELLEEFRTQSECNETYCFFTDVHCFLPSTGYTVDFDTLDYYFEILRYACTASNSSFIMCGGDLLNNGDTKSQACYKLSTFWAMMKNNFENPFFLVGNHDTNYQGDTYMSNHDWRSCILSPETIDDILYDGNKAYYRIDTPVASHYCFDSWVDWHYPAAIEYRKEQVNWFAESLLTDDKPYKTIFIHIATVDKGTGSTLMMNGISKVVNSFNNKTKLSLNGNEYDFTNSVGTIEYVQAGHEHIDIEGVDCGGAPIFITRTFASPEIATQPTFDIVFVDYSNSRILLLRIGDGEDRLYGLPNPETDFE